MNVFTQTDIVPNFKFTELGQETQVTSSSPSPAKEKGFLQQTIPETKSCYDLCPSENYTRG